MQLICNKLNQIDLEEFFLYWNSNQLVCYSTIAEHNGLFIFSENSRIFVVSTITYENFCSNLVRRCSLLIFCLFEKLNQIGSVSRIVLAHHRISPKGSIFDFIPHCPNIFGRLSLPDFFGRDPGRVNPGVIQSEKFSQTNNPLRVLVCICCSLCFLPIIL